MNIKIPQNFLLPFGERKDTCHLHISPHSHCESPLPFDTNVSLIRDVFYFNK